MTQNMREGCTRQHLPGTAATGRSPVSRGANEANSVEERRTHEAWPKCRKGTTYNCSTCNRDCQSRVGLSAATAGAVVQLEANYTVPLNRMMLREKKREKKKILHTFFF